MTVKALMVDLSSNNATPDLRAHHAAGYRVLALKVTEGTSYTWTASRSLSQQWHTLGGVVWHYHFLHPGTAASGAAQADYFWAHVRGDINGGDRVVCDIETKGETGAEVDAFWARYVTHDRVTPRVDYGSPYFLRDNGIRPHHGESLWLADYDVRPAFIPLGWATWLAWQYTDRARNVPGIPGAVDQSHLAPAAIPQPPTPKPKPVPKKGLIHMVIRKPGTRAVYAILGGVRSWVPSQAVLEAQGFTLNDVKEVPATSPLWHLPVVGPDAPVADR